MGWNDDEPYFSQRAVSETAPLNGAAVIEQARLLRRYLELVEANSCSPHSFPRSSVR
jgi:hypothetical protein